MRSTIAALLLLPLTPEGAQAGPPVDLIYATGFETGDLSEWSDQSSSAIPSVPLPGFGAIGGDCGVLSPAMLQGPSPAIADVALDFGSNPFDPSDAPLLTAGGQEVFNDDTSTGAPLLRNTFAFEVLARCELAVLLDTESEILYSGSGAKTDLRVEIDGIVVGVMAASAIMFPIGTPVTAQHAFNLLEDKLEEILESSANVAASHEWQKQVLVVFTSTDDDAFTVSVVYSTIDTSLRADTIVLIVVTDGDDLWLYTGF